MSKRAKVKKRKRCVKMEKQFILFDLDGTLTDSGEGITKSVAYAVESLGYAPLSPNTLREFIGPSLLDGFREYANMPAEIAEKAVRKYRERYRDIGIFENAVYDGVPEMLEGLKNCGKTLILATAKPIFFAKQIMQHFDLAKYFEKLFGAEFSGEINNKNAVIKLALSDCGIENKSEAVMVGDRSQDIIGAKANGIESIGVLYGYSDDGELQNAGADMICKTPNDVLNALCGK